MPLAQVSDHVYTPSKKPQTEYIYKLTVLFNATNRTYMDKEVLHKHD